MAKDKLVTVTLVLTGARANKSVALNGHNFIGGKCSITSTIGAIEAVCRYMGRSYAAFPEGSDELKDAQAADAKRVAAEKKAKEEARGQRGTKAAAEPDSSGEVPGGVQPDGEGASEETADDGGADGGSESGGSGSDAGGGRHEDTRVVSEPSIDDKAVIAEAVAKLDPANDDHWTSDGKPAVAVVTELAGRNVSRRLLDTIVPDVTRESAKAG